MPTFEEIVSAIIELNHVHEFDPSQKRDDTGKWSDGGGSSGGGSKKNGAPSLERHKPEINQHGTNLGWKSEDTIAGNVVIETADNADLSNVSDADLASYLKAHLPEHVSGIHSEDDIEDIKLTNVNRGKGYISFDVDLTPTKDAASSHYENEFQDEVDALYRSGGEKGSWQ